MRPLRTFALRNYITLIFCTVALIAFLGSGLMPASGSRDTSFHSNEINRLLPNPLSAADPGIKLQAPAAANRNDRSEAFIRKLRSASLASPFAATLTAVKTAAISTDLNNIGKADPGDTLMYTVVITNTGNAPATTVSLADMLEANLTLVPGSVVASPIAVNDTYNTIGNVNISVAAPGVLSNDLDPNGGSAVVVAPFPTTSTNGGTVSLNADGSFTYNPAAGFTGTDTFTYTAGNGTGKTDTGTVSITVTDLIWFVNSAAGVNGDGRLTSPFNVLSSAAAVDTANDAIFLYTSATNYTGGITLESSEFLIGQGASQSILVITGFATPSGTNQLPATGNATDPMITTVGTVAITLGTGNKLHGFTVGDTGAAGTDIAGTSFGTVTIKDVSVKGSGRALNLSTGTIASGSTFDLIESNGGSPAEGVKLATVGGSFTTPTTNIVNPTGTGIDVQSAPSGTNFSFGATTVNKGATAGTGVNLATNIGTFSFSSLAVTTSAGTGVSATGSGTVNVTTGSIAATGGPALLVNPTAIAMTFTTVSSTNSGTTGISLTSASGSLTIGTTTVTNPGGIGISVSTSSATLNFGATTSTQSGGTGVSLLTNTGTITFSSLNVSPDSGQRGLLATDNTTTITATSGAITTTNGIAVEITKASGTTPLAISLASVAANGGSSGIVLTNTSGSFTITGGGNASQGGDFSGGTIQSTTSHGISMNNATNISLTNLRIQTTGGSGIKGALVTNFTFDNGTITGSGDAVMESNIAFNDGSLGSTVVQISGAFSLTDSILNTAFDSGLDIRQLRGTVSNATITGNSFTSTTTTTTSKGSAILISMDGDAGGASSLTKATIDNNVAANFPSGAGVKVIGGQGNAGGPLVSLGDPASGTNIITITNNNIHGQSVANKLGTNAIETAVSPKGQGNFDIHDNGTVANPLTNYQGDGVACSAFGNSTVKCKIVNNFMVANNVNNSSNIASGVDIGFADTDTPLLNVLISGNTVKGHQGNGILTGAKNCKGTANIIITNNTVDAPTAGVRPGIRVDSGTGAFPNEDTAVCVNITGNTTGGSGGNPGIGVRKQGTTPTLNDFNIVGLSPSPANQNQTEDFLGTQNPGSALGAAGFSNDSARTVRAIVLSPPPPATNAFVSCASFTVSSFQPDDVKASSTNPVTDSPATDSSQDEMDAMNAAHGEAPKDDTVQKLAQQELIFIVQAALARWGETGIAPEDLARLRAVTFEIADLPWGQIATGDPTHIKIDETAAGYGWYFDEFPLNDSEFGVAVANRELQTTDLSVAHGKMDLLTVVMRELGQVYLQGKQRIPKTLRDDMRPLMTSTLSPSVRRLPLSLWRITPPTTGSIQPSTDNTVKAESGSQPGVVAQADNNESHSSDAGAPASRGTIPAEARHAVFNPATDKRTAANAVLKTGNATGASSYKTNSARRVAAVAAAPFVGGFTKSLGTIPVGESVTVMFQATINTPVVPATTTQVCNQGTVSFAEGPSILTDNDANAGNGINPTCVQLAQADLEIVSKADAPDPVPAGNDITYTITFKNNGPDSAINAKINDPIPANTTLVSVGAPPAGWSRTDVVPVGGTGTIVFSKASVPSGEMATFTIVVHVNPSTAGGVHIMNTASTISDTPDGVQANNSKTADTTVTAQADLAITKTDGATTEIPGTGITYTIVVTNNGPNLANGATIADTFPATLTGVSWTSVATGGATGNTAGPVSGNINETVNMPVSSTITYTVNATISPTATGSLSNTATVTVPAGVTDPVPANNSATDTDTLTPQGDLSITKTDGSATEIPGTPVTYTITVSNAGPSTATGATVADTFPAIMSGVSYTSVAAGGATGNTAGPAAGNINDTLTLPPGSSVTYTATGNISAAATGTLVNTATVTAPAGFTDTNSGNNSATDTDTLTPQADVSITKTDGATTEVPGTSITYTITVSNAGPSNAPSVVVADTFPAAITGVSFTSVAAGGATGNTAGPMAGNINDTLNLPVGASVTYTATGTISASATGSLANTATATVGGGVTDPTPGNNSATDTDTLTAQSDLSITKTDGVTTAVPGGMVTYTITVSNSGPSDATGVTVADTFPAAITSTSWTSVAAGGATGNTAGPASGNINDTVNMPAGSSITYTVMAAISPAASGSLSNTATVSGTGDPTPGNNSATDTDTLTAQGDLSITKTDGVASKVPGTSVTYTIVVSNSGPSTATGASVADTFPAAITGVTFTSVASGGATGNTNGSGNISNIVTLPPGSSITYMATGTISSAATGTLSNTATVTAPGGFTDGNPANNSATDTDTLTPQGDLSITKTDGVASRAPGTSITYTIVVTNAGPSNVVGATVADIFPATITGVTYTSVTTGTVSGNTAGPAAGNINDTVNMSAGATITYTATGTIDPSATGTLSNTATVTAPGTFTDTNPANNSATDTDTLMVTTDLSITKTDGAATEIPGTSITYTIVVTNNGPSSVVGATVADTFPAAIIGVSYTSTTTGTVSGNTAGPAAGNINDTVNMSVGATITYTATGTISPAATGSLTNTATVTSATDGNPGNNSATDTDTLTPQGDLSITKTDGVASKVPGTAVTYTIVVTNSGPSNVVGATVADTFPATITGVTYTSVTTGTVSGNTAGPAAGNINDTVSMSSGATITYTVMGTINPSATGSLSNTATVTAPAGFTDTNAGNNSATDTDTLTPQADIAVTKTDSPDPVAAGQNLTYTINFINNGPSVALSLGVSDPMPATTTLVSVTTPAGWARTDGVPIGGNGTITFTKATAASGETAVFTIVVNVPAGTANNTVLTNTVTTTTTTTDPTPANNTSTATTTVIAQADLAVTKTDSPDPVCVNGNLTYTINFTNNGPGPGLNTTVTDPVPPNTTLVSATTSSPGWSRTDAVPAGGTGNVVFSKANVANGETATFQMVVKVNAGTTHGTVINNSATAASSIPDPNPANNTGMASTTVDPTPPTFTTGCPAAVNAAAAATCPFSNAGTVNYVTPVANDNCPGVTVACVPPSGAMFPTGTTTVTCTATDTAGNTATCSFPVTVFSLCVQDTNNPGNVVLVDTTTGAYRFCCNGVLIASGTGTRTVRGCNVTVIDTTNNRNVQISVDASVMKGNATMKQGTTIVCTFSDSNLQNNTCVCN